MLAFLPPKIAQTPRLSLFASWLKFCVKTQCFQGIFPSLLRPSTNGSSTFASGVLLINLGLSMNTDALSQGSQPVPHAKTCTFVLSLLVYPSLFRQRAIAKILALFQSLRVNSGFVFKPFITCAPTGFLTLFQTKSVNSGFKISCSCPAQSAVLQTQVWCTTVNSKSISSYKLAIACINRLYQWVRCNFQPFVLTCGYFLTSHISHHEKSQRQFAASRASAPKQRMRKVVLTRGQQDQIFRRVQPAQTAWHNVMQLVISACLIALALLRFSNEIEIR